MGSQTSKVERPTPVKGKILPPEIIEEILDYLVVNSDFRSLRSCSLASRSWHPSCRRRLYHTTTFTTWGMAKWLKIFPVPGESPAHLVKDLRLSVGEYWNAPRGFFEHTSWFANVQKMTLQGPGMFQCGGIPPSARLPESVTSLAIYSEEITLRQIRNVMAQLPNLDDLSISGALVEVGGSTPREMGTALRGRFGGQLQLLFGRDDTDVMDMLLGIPTGLHFTEVHIHANYECLLSTVRFAEACSRTLVKLTYEVSTYDGRERFERSFNFVKFPNLQEVTFRIYWTRGGLPWIPASLSTIKPTTSPHLSTINLTLSGPSPCHVTGYAGPSLKELGNDLRSVEDELVRIQREFEGVVDLTTHRHPWFYEILQD